MNDLIPIFHKLLILEISIKQVEKSRVYLAT
jgi:hypothetical protein